MWRFVVRALRQLKHRAPTCLTGIGGRWRDVRAFEQNAFPNSVGGNHQLLCFHPCGNLCRHGESADDDITSCRAQARHSLSFGDGHVIECIDDVLQLDPRYDCPVDRLRSFHPDARQIHRCETGERSTRAINTRCVPVTRCKSPLQLLPNVLSQFAHGFLFHLVAEIPLRHVDGAEGQRDQAFDKTVIAQREFE